jgi:hypothetical protein
MTGYEVLDRGCAAAIRHELETGAGLLLKISPDDHIDAAGADDGQRGPVGIGFEPGN